MGTKTEQLDALEKRMNKRFRKRSYNKMFRRLGRKLLDLAPMKRFFHGYSS